MRLLEAAFEHGDELKAISPWLEIGAYEALWAMPKASFKVIADRFRDHPTALPSDFVEPTVARSYVERADALLRKRGVKRYGVRVHGAGDYPHKLRHARHPIELLYYQGTWELTETPCVAVVGTRKPSAEGIARTKKLVRALVSDKFTVVSGLADGIDSIAHATAIHADGMTISVIGTPLGVHYPLSNELLQERIARDYLLISQVPVVKYEDMPFQQKRALFPERNVTMSALTEATIIVEASETSGTLTQARAALFQKRKLFILSSCFENKALTWPKRFEEQGAIRVNDYDDIKRHLPQATASGPQQSC